MLEIDFKDIYNKEEELFMQNKVEKIKFYLKINSNTFPKIYLIYSKYL